MKKSILLVIVLCAGLCAAQSAASAAPTQPGPGQASATPPPPPPPPPGKMRGPSQMPHGGEFPFSFGPIGIGNLMKEAGISEAQMKQIDGIFEGSRHALIDQRAEVEKKEGDFQLLMQAATVDPVKSEKALDALLDARRTLSKTQTMMMVKMRGVLTQEQWHKMEQMQRRGAGAGGPGGGPANGFGGPGGGPGGPRPATVPPRPQPPPQGPPQPEDREF